MSEHVAMSVGEAEGRKDKFLGAERVTWQCSGCANELAGEERKCPKCGDDKFEKILRRQRVDDSKSGRASVEGRIVNGELDDLLKVESGLSRWEVEFVESLATRRAEGEPFTGKQTSKLHQVWDKHCG